MLPANGALGVPVRAVLRGHRWQGACGALPQREKFLFVFQQHGQVQFWGVYRPSIDLEVQVWASDHASREAAELELARQVELEAELKRREYQLYIERQDAVTPTTRNPELQL